MWNTLRIVFVLLLLFAQHQSLFAQNVIPDTIKLQKQDVFYDSLKYRADQKRVTSWIYDALISPPRPYVDRKALALDYFSEYEGKVIVDIDIKPLDVFGPSLNDTTKQAKHWAEKAANKIHTKSNLKTLRKQLLFKRGDFLDPEVMYENERIIRSLSFIKDAKIIVEQDSIYPGLVNVLVLTKDRFSFGVSGGVNSIESGDLRLYNRNIFGIGHELSVRFVGHIDKEPYLGVETFYKIKNVAGKFLDIQLGYMNTYRREGFLVEANKPFYTQTTKWGYGVHATRMLRTNRLANNDPVRLDSMEFNMSFNSGWIGRGFDISPKRENPTQLVFSLGINDWNYFSEVKVDTPEDTAFFSNRSLYMAGITLSQRRYIQDKLIYSYGITEDIPEGFKNELIYGFDFNEFGNRHYFHFYTSNGNLLLSRSGYLFLSAGIGGYLRGGKMEQGQLQASLSFITKQYSPGKKRTRTFFDANYMLGINRVPIEKLTLGRLDHIRGFESTEEKATGQQRLNLKIEHVVFMPQQFYKFNIALFAFGDLGIIGRTDEFILKKNYYAGIGVGMRLHNENLVFETIRLRFAFYPIVPKDFQFFGFVLDEQSKSQFTSFEPGAPMPMRFE